MGQGQPAEGQQQPGPETAGGEGCDARERGHETVAHPGQHRARALSEARQGNQDQQKADGGEERHQGQHQQVGEDAPPGGAAMQQGQQRHGGQPGRRQPRQW